MKLLRETYTLESCHGIRVGYAGPILVELIRHSHAILFAEGYTFVCALVTFVPGQRFYGCLSLYVVAAAAADGIFRECVSTLAFSDFRPRRTERRDAK